MPSDRSYRSGMPEPGFVDPNRGFKRRPLVEQPEPQQQEAEPAPQVVAPPVEPEDEEPEPEPTAP